MDPNENRNAQIPATIPLPMESLYETPVPPFLLKTFDLVDDSSLDSIISWGANGNSFVVWDHLEFARTILPMNFKHNNFSSFVRQLNTYGFRKIETDKWEFANEGFVRGQRHLLKNIQRRKSPQSNQTGSLLGADVEDEIERLRKERSSMMQEVAELQHQQCDTVQQIEIANEKLEAAEKRQKQLVSFLAKMFQSPAFLARLHRMRELKSITSTRTSRKFVKHQPYVSGISPTTQIMKDESQSQSFTTMPSDPVAADNIRHWPLLDIGDHTILGAEDLPYQEFGQDELAMVHELLDTPENCGIPPTHSNVNSLTEGKGLVNPEYFVSFPDDLATDKCIPELLTQDSQDMVTGSMWSMGFETSSGMSCSSAELWGNLSGCDVPELGSGSVLSDTWDIGSLNQAGTSGNEKWPDENFPPVDLENPDF